MLTIPKVNRDGIPADGPEVRWERNFLFEFGDSCVAEVTAGILEKGDTRGAGFSIFRRDRLIVGSADETYRPERVCGNPNSHAYQRLFGEIDLAGVEVSHTKDGFQWNDFEEEFLEKLRKELDDEDVPIRYQAESYRPRLLKSQLEEQQTVQYRSETATDSIRQSIEVRVLPNIESEIRGTDVIAIPDVLDDTPSVYSRSFRACHNDLEYEIEIEVVADEANGNMTEMIHGMSAGSRKIHYRLNLNHPFVRQHLGIF